MILKLAFKDVLKNMCKNETFNLKLYFHYKNEFHKMGLSNSVELIIESPSI